MAKLYLLLFFVFSLASSASFSQTYSYYFNNNLNEAGTGPALTEVLSCGASAGTFAQQVISTTAGNCTADPQTVFAFNEGGGLSFPNSSTIGSTYTIHVFFKFNSLSGYQRIIDFLNGSTDVGLYTLNDCLNFYPNGNVGACPYFVANKFYLLTLVRDGSTNTISIYINGTSFGSYNDAAATYVPSTPTTSIVFFRDNIASSAQCEDRDGSVKYISLSPTTSTPAQVSTVWTNICSIALPLKLTSFTASKASGGVQLAWSSVAETAVSRYEVERSGDGERFSKVAAVAARNSAAGASYSVTDGSPLPAINYYRLKMIDNDGRYSYSSVLKLNVSKTESLQVYPNPAHNVLTVSGLAEGKTIRLLTTDGRAMATFVSGGQSITVSLENYLPGLYILEYQAGDHMERQKFLKQ